MKTIVVAEVREVREVQRPGGVVKNVYVHVTRKIQYNYFFLPQGRREAASNLAAQHGLSRIV